MTVRGTKRDAERRLGDLLSEHNHGTFIEPNKRTVKSWLTEWVDKAIKPPVRTQRAYDTYCSVVDLHLVPTLGDIRLQALAALDLERLYAQKATAGLAPATIEKIHNVMHGALDAAVRSRLLSQNVTKLVTGKPHAPDGHGEAIEHCWTADEASAFLRAAKAAGSQPAAFFSLALDSGMRKSELCGLMWVDVDLAQGQGARPATAAQRWFKADVHARQGQGGAHDRHRLGDQRPPPNPQGASVGRQAEEPAALSRPWAGIREGMERRPPWRDIG
jgi:integrase